MATLNQILDNVAAFVDQDTADASGTELNVRVNLVNQAQNEWGDTYQWKQLRLTHSPSFALSSVSMALPTNFKKLMSAPHDASKTVDNIYREINPSDRFNRVSTEKYSYITGNDATGWALNISPALISGVSLVLDYQSTPSSMATLQDIAVCPSSQYLVKKTIGYILQSRSDSRFPLVNAEADTLLSNMIEEEAAFSGGANNRIPDYFTKNNFRVGED